MSETAGGPSARREDGSAKWREWKRKSMLGHHGHNGWQCHTCGYVLHTVDVDPGTTPVALLCQTPEGGCAGMMYSFGYPSDPVPEVLGEPTHEWYWPKRGTPEYEALDDEEQHHVDRGGLMLRERTDARPAYSQLIV